MKVKLFENGWVILGAIIITALLDLVFLTSINFGAGFVFGLAYFIFFILDKTKK